MITDIDDDVLARLQARAARHGRPVEEEARAILTDAVGGSQPSGNFMGELHRSFADLGGVELDIPPRNEVPRVPKLLE